MLTSNPNSQDLCVSQCLTLLGIYLQEMIWKGRKPFWKTAFIKPTNWKQPKWELLNNCSLAIQNLGQGSEYWQHQELAVITDRPWGISGSIQFSSVQSLSCVWLSVTPWIAACQASLSINNSRSLLKLMPIESVMPSSHLILCRPLLLLPPIPPIRVFSNESTLRMRWPKHWSFNFSISPSNDHPGLISFRMDWLDLLAVQVTLKSLLQHHSSKATPIKRIFQFSQFH